MQTKPSWKIFLGPFPTPHRLPSQLPIHIQQLREMLQRKFSLLGEQCECQPELRTSEPCPPPNPALRHSTRCSSSRRAAALLRPGVPMFLSPDRSTSVPCAPRRTRLPPGPLLLSSIPPPPPSDQFKGHFPRAACSSLRLQQQPCHHVQPFHLGN